MRSRLHRRSGRSPLGACLLVVCAGAAAGGCGEAWRPSGVGVQTAPTALRVDLARRCPPMPARCVYLRRSLQNGEDGERYVVQTQPGGRFEGVFADAQLRPLDLYFPQPGGNGRPRLRFPWPRISDRNAAGLMLRFDPPLTYLPRTLDPDHPPAFTTEVQLFDPRGKPIFTGDGRRDVLVEGYETVVAGGKTYNDCVRLRAETQLHLPWIARVTLTEYIWLAANTGIVRRMQRVNGWLFIRYFEDTFEDELIELHAGEETQTVDAKSLNPDRIWNLTGPWSAAVLYFRPSLPAPRLSGAAIEIAPRVGAVEDGAAKEEVGRQKAER